MRWVVVLLALILGCPAGEYESDDDTGDEPWWWSLREFPAGARIDPVTGDLRWTPSTPGQASFTVQLRSDCGASQQSFTVTAW